MMSIGSVSGYIKNLKLDMKWQERQDNMFRPSDKNKDGFFSASGIVTNAKDDPQKSQLAVSSIYNKLKTGMRLSQSELEYLRKYAPDLYAKAVKIQKEREEYRRELKKCKSKEEVNRLRFRKAGSIMAEAKELAAGQDNQADIDIIEMRAKAIDNEHSEFVGSRLYGELPDSDKEADSEKKSDRDDDKAKRAVIKAYSPE